MFQARYLAAVTVAALFVIGTPLVSVGSAGSVSGAIYTTTKDGKVVNGNTYAAAGRRCISAVVPRT